MMSSSVATSLSKVSAERSEAVVETFDAFLPRLARIFLPTRMMWALSV